MLLWSESNGTLYRSRSSFARFVAEPAALADSELPRLPAEPGAIEIEIYDGSRVKSQQLAD
jgi:hypothetical protein